MRKKARGDVVMYIITIFMVLVTLILVLLTTRVLPTDRLDTIALRAELLVWTLALVSAVFVPSSLSNLEALVVNGFALTRSLHCSAHILSYPFCNSTKETRYTTE